MKIGAVTIGQSPRVDVTPDILPIFGEGVELLQAGALDGLTKEQIRSMAPLETDYVLVSRLNDGTFAKFGEDVYKRQTYPNVKVSLFEGHTPLLEQKLFAGELDIIIDNYLLDESIYEKKIFMEEHLLLAVPASFDSNKRATKYLSLIHI